MIKYQVRFYDCRAEFRQMIGKRLSGSVLDVPAHEAEQYKKQIEKDHGTQVRFYDYEEATR